MVILHTGVVLHDNLTGGRLRNGRLDGQNPAAGGLDHRLIAFRGAFQAQGAAVVVHNDLALVVEGGLQVATAVDGVSGGVRQRAPGHTVHDTRVHKQIAGSRQCHIRLHPQGGHAGTADVTAHLEGAVVREGRAGEVHKRTILCQPVARIGDVRERGGHVLAGDEVLARTRRLGRASGNRRTVIVLYGRAVSSDHLAQAGLIDGGANIETTTARCREYPFIGLCAGFQAEPGVTDVGAHQALVEQCRGQMPARAVNEVAGLERQRPAKGTRSGELDSSAAGDGAIGDRQRPAAGKADVGNLNEALIENGWTVDRQAAGVTDPEGRRGTNTELPDGRAILVVDLGGVVPTHDRVVTCARCGRIDTHLTPVVHVDGTVL